METLFSEITKFQLGYLPAGELKRQRDAVCRFGSDRSALLKIARPYTVS